MKYLFLSLAALGLLACNPAASAHDTQHMDTKGMITVSATGTSFHAPDRASVSAGVVTQGLTAGEAMEANAAKMSSVFAQLKAAGIADKNIQTSQMSLQPRYDYQDRKAPKITGYEVRNTVTAKSDNLDSVGAMLDALVRAGANNIDGVQFSVKDDTIPKAKALESAIKEAKDKAEFMARSAGVKLGTLHMMSESVGNAYNPRPMLGRMMASEAMSDTQISAGEQSVSATVSLTYTIAD